MKRLLFFIPAFFLFAPSSIIHAQNGLGVRVSPAVIEERADPGATFDFVLKITNITTFEQEYFTVRRNIRGLNGEGLPIFAEEAEETGFEMSSWIEITPGPIRVAPGKTKEIPLTIRVPKDAVPGGHFGGVMLAFEPPKPEEIGASVGYQVGTIIGIRVAGDAREEAEIREFRTDREIYSDAGVKFLTRVENLGNTLIRPRGPLEIVNFFGTNVATLTMNDQGAPILPRAERNYELAWEPEGLAFGRYQAVMSLVYGDDVKKTITATVSFWILPVKVIGPVLGTVGTLIIGGYLLTRFYIRRRLKELEASTRAVRPHLAHPEVFHYQRVPFSRLAAVTVVFLISTLVFMLLLFFFLA